MRMGHGKGHDHEGHAEHASRPASGKPIDPVCGMEVEPANAAGTRVVSGETYFLCSQTCLDALDKDATMYTHPRAAHRHAATGRSLR
jgi:Cu+-exporting ATPase